MFIATFKGKGAGAKSRAHSYTSPLSSRKKQAALKSVPFLALDPDVLAYRAVKGAFLSYFFLCFARATKMLRRSVRNSRGDKQIRRRHRAAGAPQSTRDKFALSTHSQSKLCIRSRRLSLNDYAHSGPASTSGNSASNEGQGRAEGGHDGWGLCRAPQDQLQPTSPGTFPQSIINCIATGRQRTKT